MLRIHSMNGSGLYTLPPESRPGLRASEPLTGFEEEYKRNKFDFKNVKLVYLFVMMTKLLFQTPKLLMYIQNGSLRLESELELILAILNFKSLFFSLKSLLCLTGK